MPSTFVLVCLGMPPARPRRLYVPLTILYEPAHMCYSMHRRSDSENLKHTRTKVEGIWTNPFFMIF